MFYPSHLTSALEVLPKNCYINTLHFPLCFILCEHQVIRFCLTLKCNLLWTAIKFAVALHRHMMRTKHFEERKTNLEKKDELNTLVMCVMNIYIYIYILS